VNINIKINQKMINFISIVVMCLIEVYMMYSAFSNFYQFDIFCIYWGVLSGINAYNIYRLTLEKKLFKPRKLVDADYARILEIQELCVKNQLDAMAVIIPGSSREVLVKLLANLDDLEKKFENIGNDPSIAMIKNCINTLWVKLDKNMIV